MNAGIASMIVALQLYTQMATTAKLVCYFTNWSRYRTGWGKFLPENIEPFLCTHLVYAFAIIDHAHEVTEYEWNEKSLYKSFTELKKRNRLLKTLLSVREGEAGGSQFSAMMSSPDSRHTFIQSSIRLLRTHGFDGLDLDWESRRAEGVSAEDGKKFTLLCKELSEAYEAESKGGTNTRLMLSAAVAARTNGTDAGYEPAELSKYLDFISVKTFDLQSGEDGVTAHHSPLFSGNSANIDHAMRDWMERGAPAGKLLLSFPVYARSFMLSTSAGGLGAPVRGPADPGPYTQQMGVWSYYETCSFLRGASEQWIEGQKVPYAVKGNQWVGFDNQRSLDAKVDYLKSRHLGGAAVWTLDMDDFSGQFCGHGKYPLISHLKHKLTEDLSTLKTTSAVPHPTSSSPSEGPWSTQEFVTTVKPHSGCYQNITVVYPASSFCTNRGDGLYVKSRRPKTFYTCVQRKTFLTKCHIPGSPHSSAVTVTPSKDMNMVGCVLPILFHLLSVWINR